MAKNPVAPVYAVAPARCQHGPPPAQLERVEGCAGKCSRSGRYGGRGPGDEPRPQRAHGQGHCAPAGVAVPTPATYRRRAGGAKPVGAQAHRGGRTEPFRNLLAADSRAFLMAASPKNQALLAQRIVARSTELQRACAWPWNSTALTTSWPRPRPTSCAAGSGPKNSGAPRYYKPFLLFSILQ